MSHNIDRMCILTFSLCSLFFLRRAWCCYFLTAAGSGCISIHMVTKKVSLLMSLLCLLNALTIALLLTDWNDKSSESVTTNNSSIVHDILRSHLPMNRQHIKLKRHVQWRGSGDGILTHILCRGLYTEHLWGVVGPMMLVCFQSVVAQLRSPYCLARSFLLSLFVSKAFPNEEH